MFEIADRLLDRLRAGERVAVATAVSVVGSAPRTVGTSMVVGADGTVIGSISGGCVEGALYETCQQVLADGRPVVESFGFSDEAGFEVGLSCGGTIEVVVRALTAADATVVHQLEEARAGRPASLTTVVGAAPTPGGAPADDEADAAGRDAGGRLGDVVDPSDVDACTGLRLFTERSEPAPRLLVFGAVEFAVALCDAGAALGWRVTVCDPRPVFMTPGRFRSADEVVVEWPPAYLARTELDDRSVVAVLSHDDRFDAELVAAALASPAVYVGAMGSRVTHERRVRQLRALGVGDEAIARLHSPIGLDLGASTPEETAVSILAEVLAVRAGATGGRLRDRTDAIHR
ncbi:xanthine dehydrogenase accessory factor [Frigoribacterium sp. PhB160]|uniref:XdhC family protein n=1 Tax=Frigoribacterium sp. PhB160 TaxID=2485192 RepID=UPI000F4A2C1E|nr:XdhC/CoxI family protein [Frigoribacterium sp. PhB160]ROS59125.1 xanthine dehydrogenase accessory factor [Frigoribacterium sp. PhB160]